MFDSVRNDPAPAPPAHDPTVVFRGTSHDAGRNAAVTLYADRIERIKVKSFGSISRAHQDVEVTPIGAVSSVQAKKDGWRTKVTVYASGNNIEFRFNHGEATQFRDEIMKLVLAKHNAPTHVVPPPPSPASQDPMEAMRKLTEMRNAGFISDEEFEAKKADILGRM
jgi:hypothetical protein